MQGFSPVAASGGHSSSRCAGLSPSRPLLSRSTGSRRAGSAIVAHGLSWPSCSAACGILPDQGSNPRPLHWQADSQPLRHQGSPCNRFLIVLTLLCIHVCINYGTCKNYVSVQEKGAAVIAFVIVPRSVGHLSPTNSLHLSYFKETLPSSWLPQS